MRLATLSAAASDPTTIATAGITRTAGSVDGGDAVGFRRRDEGNGRGVVNGQPPRAVVPDEDIRRMGQRRRHAAIAARGDAFGARDPGDVADQPDVHVGRRHEQGAGARRTASPSSRAQRPSRGSTPSPGGRIPPSPPGTTAAPSRSDPAASAPRRTPRSSRRPPAVRPSAPSAHRSAVSVAARRRLQRSRTGTDRYQSRVTLKARRDTDLNWSPRTRSHRNAIHEDSLSCCPTRSRAALQCGLLHNQSVINVHGLNMYPPGVARRCPSGANERLVGASGPAPYNWIVRRFSPSPS